MIPGPHLGKTCSLKSKERGKSRGEGQRGSITSATLPRDFPDRASTAQEAPALWMTDGASGTIVSRLMGLPILARQLGRQSIEMQNNVLMIQENTVQETSTKTFIKRHALHHKFSGFAHLRFSTRPVLGHRISCQDTGSIVAPTTSILRDRHA